MNEKIRFPLGCLSLMTAGCSVLSGLVGGPKIEPELTPLTDSLAGKVVFSSATIPKETSTASGFLDAIELGDPLHGRAYFATSVGQRAAEAKEGCQIAEYTVDARAGGSDWEHLYSFNASSKAVEQWTTVRVGAGEERSLVPDRALGFPADKGRRDFRFATFVAPHLRVGDNPIDVRVTQGCITSRAFDTQALGTVNVRVASTEALAAWRDEIGPTLDSAPHPEAAPLIAKARRDWDASEGQLLEMTVLTSSWNIERHPATGLPLRREVPTAVVIGDGDTCIARVGFLVSEHDGNAYAPPRLFWNAQHSSPSRFPCDSVAVGGPAPGLDRGPAQDVQDENPEPGTVDAAP